MFTLYNQKLISRLFFTGQLHVTDNGVERVETVAVKMLKRTTDVEAEEDFMREVEIMSSFHHENILSLTGFCPRGGYERLSTCDRITRC